MRIGVIALPGTFDSTLTCMLDVLASAESLRKDVDADIPEIETVIAGSGSSAMTRRGLRVPIEHDLDRLSVDDLDLVVVPALGVEDEAGIDAMLATSEARTLRERLTDLGADHRPRLAGGCTGTFLLAEAGCLNDMRATTSWWLSSVFRRRYPRVDLDMTRMVVDSGSIVTAGAAFAHIDLAIGLVAGISPRLAELVSARLLVDERPALSVNAGLMHLAASDSLVSELEDWVRDHLSEAIDLAEAAHALGTTRRTLERRTRESLAMTPLQLIRRLRVERARHLQHTTALSATQIAHEVGYRDASTLQRLLRANG